MIKVKIKGNLQNFDIRISLLNWLIHKLFHANPKSKPWWYCSVLSVRTYKDLSTIT